MSKKFEVAGIEFGGEDLVLIAGPCVIEEEGLTLEIATALKEMAQDLGMPFVFKASYDKANRSSIKSFRGPGLEEGLRILKRVKDEVGVPVLTDVHCTAQVEEASRIVDIVQIPAFLCRQTDLLVEAGKHAKAVNIKKGQFMAPFDMGNAVEKVKSGGCRKVMLTERGSCFGYNNLVVDMRGLVYMREFGVPVIFDATHSVQRPGGLGYASGGESALAPALARAAVAVGVDGVFLEVHPEPEKALSDGPNMIRLSRLQSVLESLLEIHECVKPWRENYEG